MSAAAFIIDDCDDLMPERLNLVEGVIDSEVVQFNISQDSAVNKMFAADSATSMVGSMSPPHARALPDITADFFSADEIAAGSDIAYVSWAYGSSQVFPAGALALEERLAQ